MRRNQVQALLLTMAAATLAGCGGGGGADAPASTRDWALVPVGTHTQFLDGGSIQLVSRDAGGAPAAQPFQAFADSGFFASAQSDLVPGDTNSASDIFHRDADTGDIFRYSIPDNSADPDNLLGAQANADSGLLPSFAGLNSLSRHTIAVDPQSDYVAFVSQATNLAGTDSNGVEDVYVRYRGYHDSTGAWVSPPRTYRASLAADGTEPASPSFSPAVNSSGLVAFVTASALVPSDTNGTYDVYLKDLNSGNVTLVSRPGPGLVGDGPSFDPQFAGPGYLAFLSWSDNLVSGDTNQSLDLFLYDISAKILRRVPLTGTGQGDKGLLGPAYNGQITFPSRLYSMSRGGRYVAFLSESTNLVAGDTNGRLDAFAEDVALGVTVRVSTNADGSVSGATMDGIAMGSGIGNNVVVNGVAYDDIDPTVVFTSDRPYTAMQTAGRGIDVYARVFYSDKTYRLSNLATDSWPIVNVDYLINSDVPHGGSGAYFSGSAQTLSGTVSGVFQADFPPY